MKIRLWSILIILVIVPIGLLSWLGLKVARSQQEQFSQSVNNLQAGKLHTFESIILKVFEQRELQLLAEKDSLALNPAALRDFLRANPHLSHLFVLDAKGSRIFPPPRGSLSTAEEEFLTRVQQVLDDWQIFYQGDAAEPAGAGGANGGAHTYQKVQHTHGWYTWYWGSGLQFLFWCRRQGGDVIGFELNRYRLLADIIAALPAEGQPGSEKNEGRIELLDSREQSIYGWGPLVVEDGTQPVARIHLDSMVKPWQLVYYSANAPVTGLFSGNIAFNLLTALLATSLVLIGLGFYFYRESSREMREAGQRVTFVNQVSHELKTPLTNIRMYAELLQEYVDEEDERSQRYLDVVVAESQRLSRLISNVLTFARQQKKNLKLRRAPGSVDEVVKIVVESFRPSLESRGVVVHTDLDAPAQVNLDADLIGQILANLLSNVEKYAAQGRYVHISTGQDGAKSNITVSDHGPGIPQREWRKIFLPFYRLSTKLTDGVAGTGIGLSISRELARIHGGELLLLRVETGACFKVELDTPPMTRGDTT